MSAYVVDNKTISVIAKGIVEYGIEVPVPFDDMAMVLVNLRYQPIGEWLLKQNWESVCYRYNESERTKRDNAPIFKYEEPEHYDEGILFGCLRCWNYQACETPGYDESEFASMVNRLQYAILERMIKKQGMQIPWGYESLNEYDTPRF